LTTILPGAKRDASGKSPRRSGGEIHMKDHARARTKHHGQRGTADRKLRKTGYGTLQRKALATIVRHHERRGARGTHRHRAKIKRVRRSANTRARNRREKSRTTNNKSPKKTHQARLVHGKLPSSFSKERGRSGEGRASSRSSRTYPPYEVWRLSSTGDANRFGTGLRDPCTGNRNLSCFWERVRTLGQWADRFISW